MDSSPTSQRDTHAVSTKREVLQAFEAPLLQSIYCTYVDRIYRYIYRQIGNREDAEDVTAQVFLKALCELDYGRDAGAIQRWLFQVARTTLADHWRASTRLSTSSLEEMLEWDRNEPLEEDFRVSRQRQPPVIQRLLARFVTPSPEELLETDWDTSSDESPERTAADTAYQQVQRLLQTLPPLSRAVLIYRFLLNFSVRGTALQLGLTQANVKVIQFRAIKHIASLKNSIATHETLE